jgi:membrane protease YdiL (CAAX protease family)
VFNRILLVAALLVGGSVIWRRGYCSTASVGWSGPWVLALWGFLCGLPAVGLLVAVQLGTGVRVVDAVPSVGAVVGGLATGWIVASLEEPLFRGVLLRELCKKMGEARAVWVAALVFASVHFINPPGFGKNYEVCWWSGVDLMLGSVVEFTWDPAAWLRALQLVLLGWLLGVSALRWGTVAWAVGLHAVLVWGVQTLPTFTDYRSGPYDFWFPKRVDGGIDALGVILVLVVGWWIFGRWCGRNKTDISGAA